MCLSKHSLAGPFTIPDAPTFFSNIDTSYPGLEEVKAAVNVSNWNLAKEKYIEFLINRTDRRYLWDWRKRKEIVETWKKYYSQDFSSIL